MKASDLKRAADLAQSRDRDARLRARLAANEPLCVVIGEGSTQSAILLAPAYATRLRGDLLAAIEARMGEAEEQLFLLGVEP